MKTIDKYLLISLAALLLAGCREKVIDERPVKPEQEDDKYIYTKYQNPVIRNNCADPSVFDDRERSGYFYAYSTQNGTSGDANGVYLPVYKSTDMVNWELVGNAFGGMERPQWISGTRIWAPDIEYIDGRYVLYFALGHWENPALSACGVAVSDSPEGPFTWENVKEINPLANEHGMLVDYASQGVSNAIDANIIRDQKTGELYLFWGSFGSNSGVWAIQLTDDGLAVAPGAQKTYICYEMEGTYVHYKNGYYYCFGSMGSCCAGKNSTYHIVVARSQNILGPYVGKDGKYMNTKSSAFNNTNNWIMSNPENLYYAGTGHNSEIITDDAGKDWMCYHAYWQGNNYDGRCMNMDEVLWGDGWPYFKTGHPSEGKVSGPSWLKAESKSGSITIDNGNAKPLLETGDPCSCRNTWDYSPKESNEFNFYDIKLYE